jgi:glycosyltransferase involved in cell wall biosynthesis
MLLKGQLKFMATNYEVIGVSSSGNDVLNQVGKQEGVKVIPVKMTRKITPIKDLKAVWQLYKILKIEKPFIVHSHTPKAGTLGMIAAYLAKVPHRLHTIAGLPLLEATGIKRWLLDIVEKLTYKCATKIYPNSFGLRDIILKNNFTSNNKLQVIGNGSSNGIDTNHFNPEIYSETEKQNLRKSLEIDENDFVFIFIGRLVNDKGINELVNAFCNLTMTNKNVKLLLVGGFKGESDLLPKQTWEKITTHEQIITVGQQKDVKPFLAMSDALVFPSYREGFPNVVLEAGAMGLPSIVTNINGSNEIITHGENGLIVPSKDEAAFLQRMTTFVTDPKLVTH